MYRTTTSEASECVRCRLRPRISVGLTAFGLFVGAWVVFFTFFAPVPPDDELRLRILGGVLLVVSAFCLFQGLVGPLLTRLRGAALVLDDAGLSLPDQWVPRADLRRATRREDGQLRIDYRAGHAVLALADLDPEGLEPLVQAILLASAESARAAWPGGEDEPPAHDVSWERVPPTFEWTPTQRVASVDELPESVRIRVQSTSR